ncbi:MAG: hypothetical protein M0Z66_11865 [Thermaerobacter sp.]|nr:hypothetical protein [Thermaerobacter sp.]
MTIGNMPKRISLVRPPRTLLVHLPPGQMTGAPHDAAGQLAVVRAALRLLEQPASEKGLTEWLRASTER